MFIFISENRKFIYYKGCTGICVDGALRKFIDSSLITPQRTTAMKKTLRHEMKNIGMMKSNWSTLLNKAEGSIFSFYTQSLERESSQQGVGLFKGGVFKK